MAVLNPKNIYYMLSYAYRVLTQGEFKNLDREEFDNIHNLFAEIISLAVTSQIKRGLIREYEELSDDIKTVRGKINVKESLMGLSGASDWINCSFDEYTLNTPMNQVLKTTMSCLIKANDVEPKKKTKLKSLMRYFSDVDFITPGIIRWDSFRYHRNNATYRMLMNLCYLILSGMLISDKNGEYRLQEFIDNREMYALYESFIREYYRKEYPEFKATDTILSWDMIDLDSMSNLLPKMKTDVTLTWKNRTLIIDAKYYKEAVTKGPFSDKYSYQSDNLFQIYAYVKNMDRMKSGNVSGMLLYAKTDDEEFSEGSGIFDGNKISVKCLDLSGEWKDIDGKLRQIANELMEQGTEE